MVTRKGRELIEANRIDRDRGVGLQPETGEPADRGGEAGARAGVRRAGRPAAMSGGTKVPPYVHDPRRKRRVVGRKFQESFKFEGSETGSGAPNEVPAIEPNELHDLNLSDWLGGRDSNPDNRVQSAVSYR